MTAFSDEAELLTEFQAIEVLIHFASMHGVRARTHGQHGAHLLPSKVLLSGALRGDDLPATDEAQIICNDTECISSCVDLW